MRTRLIYNETTATEIYPLSILVALPILNDPYTKYERLKFDFPSDRVLRITMDVPGKLNAADKIMHDELGRIWKDVEADPKISVAVLRGAGDAFSAGGDFDMIDEMIDNFEARTRVWKEAQIGRAHV